MEISQEYHTPVGIFNHIQLRCEPSIRLILTGQCNLACDFCIYKIKNNFSPEIKSSTFRIMQPSEQIASTLTKLNSQLNYNIAHLTGGEPTTSKKLTPNC